MGLLNLFFKLNGYDNKISLKFYQGFKPKKNRDSHSYKFQTTVRGLKIFVDEELKIQITEILRGKPWDRNEKALNLRVKNSFFKPQ
jgi:hypothetical protein